MRALQAPFFEPPPSELVSSVRALLEEANNSYSQDCGGVLSGWTELAAASTPVRTQPQNVVQAPSSSCLRWEVRPPESWFDLPLGKRAPIGGELLASAYQRVERLQDDPKLQVLLDPPDIWSSPFIVAFISVGFRRLKHSLHGIVALLEQHRPDILFLGDLGTTRTHIGRLRLRIQEAVDDEWILFTDIRDSPGYPVGSGAMVHVSAAKFIQKLEIPCPPGMDRNSWSAAVNGRILLLEMNQPDAESRVWFVGFNQHVAADDRLSARDMVLSTLAHISTQAQERGWRLVLLGDANAAPAGGRWGYSPGTKTRAADQQMNDWASRLRLREILSSPTKATWKACLITKQAILDRAWVYPPALTTSNLSVQWAVTQPVFDHAMISIRLAHTVAGLGFAGACRPLHQPKPEPKCRVNMRKFREPAVLAEWSRLLQLSLTGPAVGPTAPQNEATVSSDPCLDTNGQDLRAADNDAGATDSGFSDAACGLSVAAEESIAVTAERGLRALGPNASDRNTAVPEPAFNIRNNDEMESKSEKGQSGQRGHSGLMDTVQTQLEADPYQALKYAETVANQIAQYLAPRPIQRPGDVCRAFGFAGHRRLFRELNLLSAARRFIKKVLVRSPDVLESRHRAAFWYHSITKLNHLIAKSGHPCPQQLCRSIEWYFEIDAQYDLNKWMDQAKSALDVRWATVREDYAKAQFTNIQQARERLIRNGGALDKRTLQAALGKRQPRSRMWGISGQVALGICITASSEQHLHILAFLLSLPGTVDIVCVEGAAQALQIWFRGPRALGDLLVQWCASESEFRKLPVRPLVPQNTYVAIVTDDILAVQELHMAQEGMDSGSVCAGCAAPGVTPITTSAIDQPHGNPNRAVRFFCCRCCSVYDDVGLAPMPPCPIPWNVYKDMRKIPSDLQPLIRRDVDMETLQALVRRLYNGLSVGCDGIPREFYKYGPMVLLEHLRAAINAYTRGEEPTVAAHEWMGALCGLIPKVPAPLLMTDQRPVASECTKFIITTTIYNDRLKQTAEDHQLLDDAGEGFRRYRSTRRQLSKLRAILDQLSRNKSKAVVLYLDIKNAFNAINHRAIFEILEAYGFHPLDVELFRRMYKGRFLSIVNAFGESAACFLRRGVFQGDPPSPTIFGLVFDPILKVVRASGRGCPALGLEAPSGTSAFADDTCLHTGGVDPIPAMRVVVNDIAPLLDWLGLLVNLLKSYITAINFATGQAMPTDSITLGGAPFKVLLPTDPHKHLGVRMTLTGDFAAEKTHVKTEMQRRLAELKQDEVLSSPLKELAVQVGVTSVFRYSAGIVPWTNTELDSITNMWIRAYKQAWFKKGARSMDSSPIILDRKDGGRSCPSAPEICMHEVLATLDQCMTLPGEISQIVLHHLQMECHAHGCAALNQMQLLLRIRDYADPASTLCQLLLRLDERGIVVSSPWPPTQGPVMVEVLWPQLWQAWQTKEQAAPIAQRAPLFSNETVRERWDEAKLCLQALRSLGQHGILEITRLRGQAGQWLAWREECLRSCGLSKKEYDTLTSWLDQALKSNPLAELEPTADHTQQRQQLDAHVERRLINELDLNSEPRVDLPPCIRGLSSSLASHDRICLTYQADLILHSSSSSNLNRLSDRDLAVAMCRSRAVFSFHTSSSQRRTVECLLPLRAILPSTPGPECILVQDLDAEFFRNQFSVLNVPFVRDCMLGEGADTTLAACQRPPWLVPKSDLLAWFDLHARPSSSSPWVLDLGNAEGQRVLQGIESCLCPRRPVKVPRLRNLLHPWQSDPPLPDNVSVDLSNHFPKDLPSPKGWQVCRRNARVIITGPRSTAVSLDAAQYGMLMPHSCENTAPPVPILESLVMSCRSQDRADGEYHVPWSRHLLACLRSILNVDLLIGTRAVTYNPHFPSFVSPEETDVSLGAVRQWPSHQALLLLDSFSPCNRSSVINQARHHNYAVWILRFDRPSWWAVSDTKLLQESGARLMAILPANSLVLHDITCWSNAKYDPVSSRYCSQLWLLGQSSVCDESSTDHMTVENLLGKWDNIRYDFYCNSALALFHPQLSKYRSFQQDALFFTGEGLFCGSDGSVNQRQEKMGAGSIVTAGGDLNPIFQLSAPVGGPLASIRAEAVALLSLLQEFRETAMVPSRLTIFIDCLGLLSLLSRWGRADFWPGPKDIIHFDVLLPLLRLLRSWTHALTLIKIKSHSGCYLNERADECASRGCASEDQQLHPGPQKYGILHLRIQPSLRRLILEEGARARLPADNVPNKSILRQVARLNVWRAVRLRNTIFARDLICCAEGATVARVIDSNSISEIRCWMQTVTGTYPVTSYLHRIGKAESKQCPYCSTGQDETLSHFLSVCPRFHDARTAAHNQIRAQLSSSLRKALSSGWRCLEETPLSATGLQLRRVPTALVQQSGRTVRSADIDIGSMALGRWRPDFVLVSDLHHRIAILELCRPSDVRIERLLEAYKGKLTTYEPLLTALGHYIDRGWDIQILPWVVGARGLIQTQHMGRALDFLNIPKGLWQSIIDDTVRASVAALAFMHRTRFSLPPGQSSTCVLGSTENSADNIPQCGSKRRASTWTGDHAATMAKWKRMIRATEAGWN